MITLIGSLSLPGERGGRPKGSKVHGVCVTQCDCTGSSCSAPATLAGVESRRAGGEKAGRWMDALDVCLGRAEVERSDLDPQLIITNLVSFYALSETKQVFRTEHLARNVQCSLQPGSAKAGSVSGNGKGTLCLSKDFSTAVTHGRGKEPSCTRQYTFFECFLYCQQLVVSVHSQ